MLAEDDNQGQGRPGSRRVRWYYTRLRYHYSAVKHPYFDDGTWDLKRLVEAAGE